MQPRQGDILLIPVPFTDLSSRKRRPVIVVSCDAYNTTCPDMIVVAMTSNPEQSPWSFRITSSDLVDGRLNRPGMVRVDKVYTLAQSLAIVRFGTVAQSISKRIREMLAHAIQGPA
jgi:mRNA interferase MazF